MNPDRIKEIIKQEIHSTAMDFIKNREKFLSKPKKRSHEDKVVDLAMEQEEVDNTLFYGGENADDFEMNRKKALREAEEIEAFGEKEPQITRSEVEAFEQKFKEVVTPSVRFDKGEDGEIKYDLYKGESGIDAKVSGVIPLQAENFIKFTFSLQDGPFMTARVEITPDIAEIITNLANYYEQWKDEWAKKLGNLK